MIHLGWMIWALTAGTTVAAEGSTNSLYPELSKYVEQRLAEFDKIPAECKAQLGEVAKYIAAVRISPTRLIFICTHNSRRSHMAQLWAAVAASYYGVAGTRVYSGGTEATAFNERAVTALKRAGFHIVKTTDDENPIYHVRFTESGQPLTCFSKTYGGARNPQASFAAVMTCSQADRACPMVRGAEKRFTISYDDPKAFDGTSQETEQYDDRCEQIAREMLYVFSQVRPRHRNECEPRMKWRTETLGSSGVVRSFPTRGISRVRAGRPSGCRP